MISKYINLSTVAAAFAVFYVYMTYTKIYQMMHPLDGIEIAPGSPTVSPHWQENSSFSVLCFLSANKRFSQL